MSTIEIRSILGDLLWSGEARSICEAVERAVKDRASLVGANLDGARLDRARLDRAALAAVTP